MIACPALICLRTEVPGACDIAATPRPVVLKAGSTAILSLDAENVLPLPPGPQPLDQFLVGVANGEVLRRILAAPHAGATPFLPLIDKPVIVALEDDMPFRGSQHCRAEA